VEERQLLNASLPNNELHPEGTKQLVQDGRKPENASNYAKFSAWAPTSLDNVSDAVNRHLLPSIETPILATYTDRVAADLVYMISVEVPARQLPGLRKIIEKLPPLLGSSPALVAALECCMHTNALVSLVPYHSRRINPVLYGKALRSLQMALRDSHQTFSQMTLAAMIMISRVEVSLSHLTNSPFTDFKSLEPLIC
jgi:hypothetical protein